MDVYLVDPTTNLIYNCIVVDSVALAQEYYPQYNCFERTASNAYLELTPIQIIEDVADGGTPINPAVLGDEYHD